MRHRYQADRWHTVAIVSMIGSVLLALLICVFFKHSIDRLMGTRQSMPLAAFPLLLIVAFFLLIRIRKVIRMAGRILLAFHILLTNKML